MQHAKKKRRERVAWLDFLKTASVYAMVLLHLSAAAFNAYAPGTAEWASANALDSACRWCVPAFVMVSGALFLDPGREVTARRVWSRYVPRLAVAYLAWSLAYAAQASLSSPGPVYPKDFLRQVLTGEFHMWFVPMLVGLYALVPVLRPVAADRRTLAYATALCLALVSLRGYAPLLPGPSVWEGWLSSLSLDLGYVGYLLLGCLVASSEPRRWHAALGAALLAIGFLATDLGTAATYQANDPAIPLYEYTTANVCAEAAGALLLARSPARSRPRSRACRGPSRACSPASGSSRWAPTSPTYSSCGRSGSRPRTACRPRPSSGRRSSSRCPTPHRRCCGRCPSWGGG